MLMKTPDSEIFLKSKEVVLPMKLSSLIEIALRDMKTAEAAGATINMGTWYETTYDGTCSMCAAGAVMAMTLQQEAPLPNNGWSPQDCPQNVGQLHAIDKLRSGQVRAAGLCLGMDISDNYDAYIPNHARHKDAFYTRMKNLQKRLEAAGY